MKPLEHSSQTEHAIKICYVLSYYSPEYVRTRVLITALRSMPSVALFEARNTSVGFLRYFETLWRLLRIRIRHNPDVYLIGFRGHEIVFPALLIIGSRKRIIFDEFVSPYDSLVYERQELSVNSPLARIVYALEKWILKNANILLTDAAAQAAHYARLFSIDLGKFVPIPVGVDGSYFNPTGRCHDYATEDFVVFTYATFLPLHGIDIVLQAAKQLEDLPIRLVIAGGRRAQMAAFRERIRELDLDNIDHIPWIDFDALPDYIRGAQVCLGGPFGNTPQANRVITGKTVQFLACGKATIIGESEETLVFVDRYDCILVPQGDAVALASAIRWAFVHKNELPELGRNARRKFEKCFSQDSIRRHLEVVLKAARDATNA